MIRNKHNILIIFLSILLFIMFLTNYNHSIKIRQLNDIVTKANEIISSCNNQKQVNLNVVKNINLLKEYEEDMSRDFFRYKCKNRMRLGGMDHYLNAVPHKLYRVEGAWFVCLDDGIAPIKDDCVVLSFGINDDESFDRQMFNKFKCQIESFDPFVENSFFSNLRAGSVNLANEITLRVNDKWRFHRIGLIGDNQSVKNQSQIGWMARLDQILNYTKLVDKKIDIFKMDIENGEWEFLLNINMDYLCKYVKQFMLETHTPEINPKVFNVPLEGALKLMRQLEKCFLLYHRDTRFYKDGKAGKYGFWKTEFQEPIEYKIDLKEWKDETQIIDFMVTYGELYFVNKNYL